MTEETGLPAGSVYLEQLYTFGEANRDPRLRVITVAYFALIPSEKLNLKATSDAANVRWFNTRRLPRLAFDHREIVMMAHTRLTARLDGSTLAFQFLPDEFTLTELQSIYEIIQGRTLDKRNFRKRIQNLDLIEETGEMHREGAHRPARFYRLKETRRLHKDVPLYPN